MISIVAALPVVVRRIKIVFSRKLYIKVLLGMLLVLLLSYVGAFLLITEVSYTLSFVCLIFTLLIIRWIIRCTNEVNKKVAFFFSAVKNRDASLHFQNVADDPLLASLQSNMNEIVSLLNGSRYEVEEKRLYYESVLRVLMHEIRNSVTPVTSLSADLLQYCESYTSEQLKESLEVINGQAKNLSAFLDSYHRLTHLPEPDMRMVDVTELFRRLERLLCAEPDSKEVRYVCHEPVMLHADVNLITLALINLIRNGLQAVSAKGNEGEVVVEALIKDGCVCILVSDNGTGIPDEFLSSVFIPFFSTKPEGSGIGLSIVERVVKLHDGHLSVSSQPGVRTTFIMTFNNPVQRVVR
ncbi:sensor histidine kinase [Parabacteroides bouchesdurhonensis]|uniref:sensor histidine kinase n=1 Tax=Parabacteroides bouchesdurhonensis TaxID=1936995 RepID=UPI001F1B5684|nr:HAMP domain-containing sensor histidine kinase [Parabacteroides bouchesdurhonensis]